MRGKDSPAWLTEPLTTRDLDPLSLFRDMLKRLFPALLATVGACYRYAPINADALRPGTSVRARIGASQAEQVAPLLGMADARLLTGRYVASVSDTLILEVPTSERVVGPAGEQTLHQRVGIPRAALLELETRTLDRKRTSIVAGTAALVVGSLLVKNLVIDPGREQGPTGTGGTELLPRP